MVHVPKRMCGIFRGRKEGSGQDLKVNQDRCQECLIEKRLQLLYSIVAYRIKWEKRGNGLGVS